MMFHEFMKQLCVEKSSAIQLSTYLNQREEKDKLEEFIDCQNFWAVLHGGYTLYMYRVYSRLAPVL